MNHRGRVNNFADFNGRYGVGPGDRLLALASMSFDMCAYDVFGTLAAGAALVVGDTAELDPGDWARQMVAHRVTLWHSVPATVAVESLLLAAGLALYVRTTVARDRIGAIGPWALALFLVVVNVANVLGPPPPSDRAVAWVALSMWLIVAAGYYVDRHRLSREMR